MHTLLRPLALALFAAALHGCASSTIEADSGLITARPPDAAISLSVSGDQPAWFLVDSDGALRASLGERTEITPSPPLVRMLTDAQWDALWEASLPAQAELRALGADAATGPAWLEVRSRGRIQSRNGAPMGPGVQSLAAQLRELSWADGR